MESFRFHPLNSNINLSNIIKTTNSTNKHVLLINKIFLQTAK